MIQASVSRPPHHRRRVAIAGGGLAGLRAAEELRRQGFDGSIRMVSAERVAPYDRPQLSKSLLIGTTDTDKAIYRDAEYYKRLDIELLLEHRIASLDLREHCLKTNHGYVDFDELIICTGAAPRRLGGVANLAGIHELRTLDDGVAIRDALASAPRVVVVGAGFIGSEVAASARALGLDVTIVEASPAPLARALGDDMGLACAGLHADHGTRLIRGVSIASVEGSGRVERVRLTDGTVIDCDLLVVGIGVVPTVEWLAGSGLPLDNGVVCDATLSPARGVYAAGDVASWPNGLFDQRMRGEQWTNAVEQGRHVARNILANAGEQLPFHGSNYFWSDQYGVRIQFAGITEADEIHIVEGSVAERRFLAWYRRGDRLVGALAMNEAKSLMLSKTLIERRASWSEGMATFEKAAAS